MLSSIDQQGERHGVVSRISRQLDIGPETLRHWSAKQRSTGAHSGVTSADRERITEPERENRELRRANQILKEASMLFFASEPPDKRGRTKEVPLASRSMRVATSRLYREIVKGRTKVRIVEADQVKVSEERPIFILGLYRSGTTLLRYVLDSHTRIAVPPESGFLLGLHEMLEAPRAVAGFDGLGFDRAHVISRMREFADYFFVNYARSKGKPRWGDKTPAYVEYLDFIQELYPESQYVILTRNPLDQVHSFVSGSRDFAALLETKYGDRFSDPRIAASHYWTENTGTLLRFAQSRPGECFVIPYEDLATSPAQVLPKLFSFLDEGWEESVLRFYEFDHDFGLEDNKARLSRGFSLSTGRYEDWPSEVVDACLEVTEPVRKLAHY